MVLETWFREMVDGRAAFAREIAARAETIAAASAGSASGSPLGSTTGSPPAPMAAAQAS
jgi:hypothetical protein